jgi:hypothetical protein
MRLLSVEEISEFFLRFPDVMTATSCDPYTVKLSITVPGRSFPVFELYSNPGATRLLDVTGA